MFWAVRVLGPNFDIAVAFEFVVDDVYEICWSQMAFQTPDPAEFLTVSGRVVAEPPRGTTPFLLLGRGMAQVMAMVDSAAREAVIGQLEPFAEIAPYLR